MMDGWLDEWMDGWMDYIDQRLWDIMKLLNDEIDSKIDKCYLINQPQLWHNRVTRCHEMSDLNLL